MTVFGAYAGHYDRLYRDKDYAAEARWVAARLRERDPVVRRILDLGCGSGAHAVELARLGFDVTGVDRSSGMLALAERRRDSLAPEIASRLQFLEGDVRALQLGRRFDAVVSLFHVVSYQVTDADLAATFGVAAQHLLPGGTFLFDHWYGPAVLAQRPEHREKRLEDETVSITRIARPLLHEAEHKVEVHYEVLVEDKRTKATDRILETHELRYFETSELRAIGEAAGFEAIRSLEWLGAKPPTPETWSATQVMACRSSR